MSEAESGRAALGAGRGVWAPGRWLLGSGLPGCDSGRLGADSGRMGVQLFCCNFPRMIWSSVAQDIPNLVNKGHDGKTDQHHRRLDFGSHACHSYNNWTQALAPFNFSTFQLICLIKAAIDSGLLINNPEPHQLKLLGVEAPHWI
ncbi:hypothetical protein PIB30_030332 [Stylosanthes scabra]|uniref:Uncharacterized protein n=1 Tax=Stylosanthes scabra TaxID=79078 RepID=A0ABU6TBT3_9FABA|nr:hypothetical protein [Stylosanthes scabra]